MRTLFGFLFVFALVSVPLVGCGGDGDGDQIAQLLEEYFDDYVDERVEANGPGVVMTVLGPDGVVFEKSVGMANIDESIAIGSGTPFSVGSVEKQFAAMAVLILFDAGEVALDDPISGIFPEGPASWADITVHHLLTHQSGIPNLPTRPEWTEEEVLAWAIDQPLGFTPGERFEYSNTGYVMLYLLVDRIADEPFETFVADRILGPLGMQDSGVSTFPTDVPERAISYIESAPFELPINRPLLYATIDDLKLWEAELRNPTLVSSETFDLMVSPHVATPEYGAPEGGECFYGYGMYICDFPGWPPNHEHFGTSLGFRGTIIRVAEEDLGVLMLSNGNFDWAARLSIDLVNLYLNGEPFPEMQVP